MDENRSILPDLHHKIAYHLEKYKKSLLIKREPNLEYLLHSVDAEADLLLYNIKYETEQCMEDYLSDKKCSGSDYSQKVNSKKTEALIRLQTLTSLLTCDLLKL